MPMQKVTVGPATGGFPVYVGTNILDEIVLSIVSVTAGNKLFVVADGALYSSYVAKFVAQLRARGCDVRGLNLDASEHGKTLEQVNKILQGMVSFNCPSSTYIIAVGGGSIIDMTALAASQYHGGVRYITVPTTFAAMCSSAVCGYHSINAGGFKDQISSVHYPSYAYCDTGFLQTLSKPAFAEGLFEVIKLSVIHDPALFNYVSTNLPIIMGMDSFVLTKIISRCADIIGVFMKADEKAKSAQLNLELGNTIGHALEAYTQFGISHGNAASVGMLAAARVARDLGLLPVPDYYKISGLLEGCGLPVVIGACDHARIIEAISHDRKAVGSFVKFILPVEIGRTVINDQITVDTINRVLEEK